MSLKLVSLASGSRGNATLVFSDSAALLVDAGVSYTRIKNELKDFGLTPSMLDGVVITHEHTDHIAGLARLEEECKVYAHPLTQKAIYTRQGVLKNVAEVDFYEDGFDIGDIHVEPFRIPHDAVYPLAYTFSDGRSKCSVATDIGTPTHGVLRNVRDSQVVLLESNHDVDMLKTGRYPASLKARILSGNGHLSNDSAARIAGLLSGASEVRQIILGHISENNNTERLAYATVSRLLEQIGDSDISLSVAHQDRKSEVFEAI